MKVAIRADASVAIGTGHIMRCLTLAEELRTRGVKVKFYCVPCEGNLVAHIRKKGYECIELGTADADIDDSGDWLIVDHYQLDCAWETRMGEYFKRLLVIDDFVNRKHKCDILLNQNVSNIAEVEPQNVKTRCLCGPQYALLRKEFLEMRRQILLGGAFKRQDNRAFIFFGGSDPTQETLKLVKALIADPEEKLYFDILVGKTNPDLISLKTMTEGITNIALQCHSESVAQLMARASVGVGSAGSTTWERLCVGLPSVLVMVADNQQTIVETVSNMQCAVYLGKSENVSGTDFLNAIKNLMQHSNMCEEMRKSGMELVDGLGCQRVVDIMLKDLVL